MQHGREVARHALHHVQPHVRVACAHGLHQWQAEYARSGGRQPHGDGARQPRLLRRAHGLVGMAQGELRLAKERQPCLCGRDAARRALQQARGQLALQPGDLLAERGLHHVQVQRSAAHGALLHHTHEIAQLSQFHGRASGCMA
ncbi:hypothetical protein D3C71_1510770 [compost metagenome]